MRKIYASENGDIWHLLRDLESGHTFVRHTANEPSGGNVVDISLPVFLSLGRGGPEHEALWAMIGTLIDGSPSAGLPRQTGLEAAAAAAAPSPCEAMGSVNV